MNRLAFRELVPSILFTQTLLSDFVAFAKRNEETHTIVIAKVSYSNFPKGIEFLLNQIIDYNSLLEASSENQYEIAEDEVAIDTTFISYQQFKNTCTNTNEELKSDFFPLITINGNSTFNANCIYRFSMLVSFSNGKLHFKIDYIYPKAVVTIEECGKSNIPPKIKNPVCLLDKCSKNSLFYGIDGIDDPRLYPLALSVYLYKRKPFISKFNFKSFHISVENEFDVDVISILSSLTVTNNERSINILQCTESNQSRMSNLKCHQNSSSFKNLRKGIKERDLIHHALLKSILHELQKISRNSKRRSKNKSKINHSIKSHLSLSNSFYFETKNSEIDQLKGSQYISSIANSENEIINNIQYFEKQKIIHRKKVNNDNTLEEKNINVFAPINCNLTKIKGDSSTIRTKEKLPLPFIVYPDNDTYSNLTANKVVKKDHIEIANIFLESSKIYQPNNTSYNSQLCRNTNVITSNNLYSNNESSNLSQNLISPNHSSIINMKSSMENSLTLGTDEMSIDTKLFMKLINDP